MRWQALFLMNAGAAAVGVGAFLDWYAGQSAAQQPARDLVAGVSDRSAPFGTSIALVLVVLAAVVLLGAARGARWLAGTAAGACFVVLLLWSTTEGLHRSASEFGLGQVQPGAWTVLGGTLAVAGGVLAGRRRRSPYARR